MDVVKIHNISIAGGVYIYIRPTAAPDATPNRENHKNNNNKHGRVYNDNIMRSS